MKPQTIRFMDIWLGRVACFLLTCLRRIAGSFHRAGTPQPPEKILFIKLIEQGATVLAYGAIQQAAAMVGRSNLFFLVFEENREILDIMEMIPASNILSIRNRGPGIFLYDLLRQVLRIRRLGIDACVDMEFFARAPAIISFLTGAQRRVGFHRFTGELPYRGDLMTHRIQYSPHLHTFQVYRLLVDALALPEGETPMPKILPVETPDRPPPFHARPKEVERFRERAGREGLSFTAGEPVIILNPNASDMLPLRKWPLDHFITLGSMVLRDYPQARLVITGTPAESDSAERMYRLLASFRVVNLAGKTSLSELLILYTLSDLLITNDSGPAHFASLTDIRSIILYGPETPKLFGAIGPRSRHLSAGLACSPCVSVFNHRFSPCRDNLCMQRISPQEVYAAVRDCIEGRHP